MGTVDQTYFSPIGNRGVYNFALTHAFKSGETVQDLLDAGRPPPCARAPATIDGEEGVSSSVAGAI